MAENRGKAILLVLLCIVPLFAGSAEAAWNKNGRKQGRARYPPSTGPISKAPYGQGGNYTGFGLRFNYYRQTCPQAESVVTAAVKDAFNADNSILGGIIRLFFHDCFVRGCDASVLLDGPDSEKLGAPNANSLRGFEIIDKAKATLEAQCKGIVSCADILAYAARDSLTLGGATIPFGLWLGGRRDGDVSVSSETLTNLPAPFSNWNQLVQAFARKGLNAYDLVALSAGHTVGHAHCGIILSRIYNFQGTGKPDPAIDPSYVPILQRMCPSTAPGNLIDMEMRTPNRVDTNYFQDVLRGRGLFESDNALRTTAQGQGFIRALNNPAIFGPAFTLAMLKMGTIEVKTGSNGKIHANCRSTA